MDMAYSTMMAQAGSRKVGSVVILDTFDGRRTRYSSHFESQEEFDEYCNDKINGYSTRVIEKKELI
jgi:hypothetical protein